MYTIAATDLDDTLIRSEDWKVSTRALTALHKWADTRGPVIIATGRPPRWTRKIHESLHDFPWICYNGAVAYENGEQIYENLISVRVMREVVKLFAANAPDARVGLEIDDILYINQPIERPHSYYVPDLLTVADRPAAKILLSTPDYHALSDQLLQFSEEAKSLVSDRVSLVQMMATSTSKGHALTMLMKKWGRSMDEIVSFGDDVNDIEMLQESGLGIAVENAVPEVLAVADRVTASNNDDGVALILEELLTEG